MESINIGRTFRIRERKSLEVRAEFFNVLNRMEINGPTTSSPQGARSCSITVPTAGLPGSVNVAAGYEQLPGRLHVAFGIRRHQLYGAARFNLATAKSSPGSRSKNHRLPARGS